MAEQLQIENERRVKSWYSCEIGLWLAEEEMDYEDKG
jgi:hypothetical protein